MIKKWIAVCAMVFAGFSCGTVNALAAVSINSLEKSVHLEKDFDNLSTVTLQTEHEVYGTDMKSIILLITNNSKEVISYSTPYELEVYNSGKWYAVPLKHGFDDVAITLAPDNSNAEYISLQHEVFRFDKGQYRVVKKVGDNLYQAQFKLGKSSIMAETPYGFVSMEKLPSNYTRREAATAGDIVITKEGEMNNDAFGKFLEKVNIGIPAMLRITNVEDVRNPKVMDIIYDKYFLVREGNLAKIEKTPITEKVYSYLNAEENNVFLSNYASGIISRVYKNPDNVRIPVHNESEEGKRAVENLRDIMKKRTTSSVTTFRAYSPDRLLNASLDASPMKFAVSGEHWGSTVDLVDEKHIVTKIMDIAWIDNTHFMLTCDTSEDQKYFAVYKAEMMKSTLVFSQYGATPPKHTINMNLTR